jgi:hypothetical protein
MLHQNILAQGLVICHCCMHFCIHKHLQLLAWYWLNCTRLLVPSDIVSTIKPHLHVHLCDVASCCRIRAPPFSEFKTKGFQDLISPIGLCQVLDWSVYFNSEEDWSVTSVCGCQWSYASSLSLSPWLPCQFLHYPSSKQAVIRSQNR